MLCFSWILPTRSLGGGRARATVRPRPSGHDRRRGWGHGHAHVQPVRGVARLVEVGSGRHHDRDDHRAYVVDEVVVRVVLRARGAPAGARPPAVVLPALGGGVRGPARARRGPEPVPGVREELAQAVPDHELDDAHAHHLRHLVDDARRLDDVRPPLVVVHVVVLRDIRLQRLRQVGAHHPALQVRDLVLELLLVARVAVLGQNHGELARHVREEEGAEGHAGGGDPALRGGPRGDVPVPDAGVRRDREVEGRRVDGRLGAAGQVLPVHVHQPGVLVALERGCARAAARRERPGGGRGLRAGRGAAGRTDEYPEAREQVRDEQQEDAYRAEVHHVRRDVPRDRGLQQVAHAPRPPEAAGEWGGGVSRTARRPVPVSREAPRRRRGAPGVRVAAAHFCRSDTMRSRRRNCSALAPLLSMW